MWVIPAEQRIMETMNRMGHITILFVVVGLLGCGKTETPDSGAVLAVAVNGNQPGLSGDSQWLLVGGGAVPELNQISRKRT